MMDICAGLVLTYDLGVTTMLREYYKTTIVTSMFMFFTYLFVPVLSPYIKSLGFSEFQIGMMFAAYPLACIFFSSPIGNLSDVIGRKKVILLGIVSLILANVLYMTAFNSAMVLAARVLDACSFVAVVVVGLASAEDHVAHKTRGKYSGVILSFIGLGSLIAPPLGGLLADFFFVKMPFLFSGIGLLIMLWVVGLREHISVDKKPVFSDMNLFRQIRRFFSNRKLAGMGILGIVMHAGGPLILIFIPIYVVDGFNLSYQFVGYALLAFNITHIFQFLTGKVSDSLGSARVMVAGVIGYAACLVLMALMPSYWFFVLIFFFAGVAVSFWNVSAISFMSDIGEDTHSEGFVMGTYSSVAKIGAFVSTIVGGLVIQLFSINVLMIGLGIVIFLGALLSLRFIFGSSHKITRKAER